MPSKKAKSGKARLTRDKAIQQIDALNDRALTIGFDHIEEAYRISTEAAQLSKRYNYARGMAYGQMLESYYEYFLTHYEKALALGREALSEFEALDDREGMARTLSGFGYIHWGLGDFDQALAHIQTSLEMFEQLNLKNLQSWSWTALGAIYAEIGDPDQALFYHYRSLDLFRQLNDQVGIGRALSGIGTVYHSLGESEQALDNHLQSLKLYRREKSKTGESRALNDIGMIYQGLGKLEEALKYHRNSLKIRRQLGNKSAEITSLINLGRVFNGLSEGRRAIRYLNKALASAQSASFKPKIYLCHEALSTAYELIGEHRKALEHQKRFVALKQEVFSKESEERLKTFQIRIEIEKAQKEAEIHKLRHGDLAETLDQLKKTQASLVQSEKMAALGNLVAGIAHEVNNPIAVIASGIDTNNRAVNKLEQAVSDENGAGPGAKDADLQSRFIKIRERNARSLEATVRIKDVIGRLKAFARLDRAELQLADIHEGLESAIAVIAPRLTNRIKIERRYGKLPRIYCYLQELNQAFLTLLINAAEAIGNNKGTIKVTTRTSGQTLAITISDSGRGLTPEKLAQVFAVHYSGDTQEMRIHVGLSNAANIIKRHRGQITAASDPGRETVFKILIPCRTTKADLEEGD